MASAKRKTTAKRTTKRTTKTAKRTAKSVAKKATQHAARSARTATKATTQQWQKGANKWAKQSAKLYQLPFNGDAAKVAQQASEQVKSATESFVRAGNDMMSQMFGGTDPMAQWKGWMNEATASAPKMPNAGVAAEKMRDLTRESAQQANKMAGDATRALSEAGELARENAEAMVEVGNVAINVSKEIGAELISYANRTFSQNVELGKQLLSCRTLNDMFDLSSKVAKTNLDGFFSESVKLSEKLFQLGTDVSEPLNERVSATSERLSRTIAA